MSPALSIRTLVLPQFFIAKNRRFAKIHLKMISSETAGPVGPYNHNHDTRLKIGILSCLQTAIVCGLLRVEIILCRFFLLFIYVCVAIGDSIFKKEREGWDAINLLILPHFSACPKPGTRFPTTVEFAYNEQACNEIRLITK